MDKSTKSNPPSPQVVHYEENEIDKVALSIHEMNQGAEQEQIADETGSYMKKRRKFHLDDKATTVVLAANEHELTQEVIDDMSLIGKRNNVPHEKQELRDDIIEEEYSRNSMLPENDEEEYHAGVLYEPLDYRKDWSYELQMTFFSLLSSKLDFDNYSLPSYSLKSITSATSTRKKAKTVS
mmetsp:Transcript_12325/g.23090  ORF Transcript_12325/g.23090 Transcript_12325/m.23090 type:complete len:181 (+) Transcript_12325:21-563(+)